MVEVKVFNVEEEIVFFLLENILGVCIFRVVLCRENGVFGKCVELEV